MDYDKCAICKEGIRDESGSHLTLTEKGAIGVCNASKERHDELVFTAGEKVHKSCRDSYINKKNIKLYNKKRKSVCHDGSPVKRRFRTDHEFDYKLNCLFCRNPVTERDKRNSKAYQVMCKNREFDISILKICEQRNDPWAVSVKGRIAYVNDLHSEDAVYHQACSINFRTGKDIPETYEGKRQSRSGSKRGRPLDLDRESAFNLVCKYLPENDDEQVTISDLILIMQQHLKDSTSEAFTSKWMKVRLTEQFKDEIVFTEINGKQNVVIFRSKAKNILPDFYKSWRSDDVELEKTRIIKTAAMLLKMKLKSVIVPQQHIHQLKILNHSHVLKSFSHNRCNYS